MVNWKASTALLTLLPAVCASDSVVPKLENDGWVAETCFDTTVRIMIGYTAEAEAAAPDLFDIIIDSWDAMQEAFAASETGVSVELACVEQVPHPEEGSYFQMLQMFTNDAVMDGIRNGCEADLVVIIVAKGGQCGIGWQLSPEHFGNPLFAKYAYGLAFVDCARDRFTVVHEVGHLMGCCHQPGACDLYCVEDGSTAYVDGDLQYSTVMSTFGTLRVPRFSNPDVLYDGQPTGTPDQNNAAALALTAPFVSGYRCSNETTVAEDVNLDGCVDNEDMVEILSHWGEPSGVCDLDGNGTVGVGDLLACIAGWGC